MTDQRYTGPDGAKRLELLEELAKAVDAWRKGASDYPVRQASAVINLDNGRLDRLEQGRFRHLWGPFADDKLPTE